MITGEPAVEWAPFEYLSVPLPAASGKPGQVGRPAVLVQARHRDSRPWTGASHKVQLHGIIDSGADTSVVPLRALRGLGAAVDDGSRRSVYGVAGILHAYSARIGLEIKHGRRWLDMGTADVSAPDTEWLRDPAVAWPFVPGLGGSGYFQTRISKHLPRGGPPADQGDAAKSAPPTTPANSVASVRFSATDRAVMARPSHMQFLAFAGSSRRIARYAASPPNTEKSTGRTNHQPLRGRRPSSAPPSLRTGSRGRGRVKSARGRRWRGRRRAAGPAPQAATIISL